MVIRFQLLTLHLHCLTAAGTGVLGNGLILVRLRDEGRKGNIRHFDACPCHVLDEAFSAHPRLESCSVEAALHSDVLEKNVADVLECGWVLTKRTNAHAMGFVPNR